MSRAAIGVTGDSPSDATGQPGGLRFDDVRRSPYVQLEGGFLAGLSLGFVPFGAPTKQALDPTPILPTGTREAQIGYSIGLFVGGMYSLLGGVGGGALSIGATSTGVGAAAGVPGLVISAGAVANGIMTISAGVTALSNAMMMSSGSGGSGAPSSRGKQANAAGGAVRAASKIDRAAFKAEREAFWKAEAKNNPGKYSAEDLAKMEKGRAPTGPDGNPMELHHVDRTPEGGVKPMTREEHRLGDNYKKNHPE